MIALLAALVLPTASAEELPGGRPCTAQEVQALTAVETTPYRLTCRAELKGGRATRPILIQGAEASGAGIDCGGGSLGRPGFPVTTREPTVAIWSRAEAGGFSRPRDIYLRNCTLHGAVRVWGMGAGGSMSDLLASSRTADHTAAAQGAAPTRIALDRISFMASGSIPLYVGPGVTALSLTESRFSGRSVSVAVYLDAESRENSLIRNVFDITTGREQVAVDGSASNRISGNRFNLRRRGGIFLYRNCGEDGVIRHQTPSDNIIVDNVFTEANWLRPQTVVVGAREGRRNYCAADRGWPFGSSADDGDNAARNLVERNRIER